LVPSLPATLAPPPTAAPLNIKPSTVAESEKRIAEFLKTRGITSSENGIKTGKDKSLPIAYQDMIYDLTHNIDKKNANLTEGQTIKTLSLLKSIHMPASHIRNKNLRNQHNPAAKSIIPLPIRFLLQTLTTPRRGRPHSYLQSV
jgi:hypothetical protein